MAQRHRPELSESVTAEPVVTYRRTPRTFSPGRMCAAPGCLTVLSIDNAGEHCSSHHPGHLWAGPTRTSARDITRALSATDGLAAPGAMGDRRAS
jgi:hypothetical protein